MMHYCTIAVSQNVWKRSSLRRICLFRPVGYGSSAPLGVSADLQSAVREMSQPIRA